MVSNEIRVLNGDGDKIHALHVVQVLLVLRLSVLSLLTLLCTIALVLGAEIEHV